MNGAPAAGDVVFYVLLLVLPLSALLAQRMPLGSTLKMAAAWVAIFVVALLLMSQRERLRPLWQGTHDLLLGRDQTVSGGTVRIAMADDGHFYADVRINGVARRMLVDSGATTTALSVATAKAAGVVLSGSPFPVFIDTANGQVEANAATVAMLELGPVTAQDLPVVVAPAFGDSDVLGMNFLSRLRGWQVDGRTLILNAEPT